MSSFNVEVYIDDVYVKSLFIEDAFDEEEAFEEAHRRLQIDLSIEEIDG